MHGATGAFTVLIRRRMPGTELQTPPVLVTRKRTPEAERRRTRGTDQEARIRKAPPAHS